jgi:hypothetical protein
MLWEDRAMTQRRGRAAGKPQQHRRASYDPDSGKTWRTGVVVQPDDAVKALRAADLAGLSFAGLVAQLIRRMDVDEDGRPMWADEVSFDRQEELPQAG